MTTKMTLWLLSLIFIINTVNAAAPTFDMPPSGGGSESIGENEAVGSPIITLQATDTDGDPLTFTVALQTPTSPAFTVNGNDELIVPTGLDYEIEEGRLFTLTLSVTDGTNTATTTYTLTITDVDDTSPVFSQATYTATILNSASAGTTVATVTAEDVDSSSFTYSIQGAQTTFAISAAGVITVSDPSGLSGLGSSVTLNIQANDDTNTGTATVAVTIQASPCDSSPCQNGGTCTASGSTASGSTHTCTCLSGYTGDSCESVDRCIGDPCKNGASCESGALDYTCKCRFCAAKVGNCTADDPDETCSHLGSCNAKTAGCICTFFDGGRCEKDVAIVCVLVIVLVVLIAGGIIIIIGYIEWTELCPEDKESTTFRVHMTMMLTCKNGKSRNEDPGHLQNDGNVRRWWCTLCRWCCCCCCTAENQGSTQDKPQSNNGSRNEDPGHLQNDGNVSRNEDPGHLQNDGNVRKWWCTLCCWCCCCCTAENQGSTQDKPQPNNGRATPAKPKRNAVECDKNGDQQSVYLELQPSHKSEKPKRKKKRTNKDTSEISKEGLRDSIFTINLPEGGKPPARLQPLDEGNPTHGHTPHRKLPDIPPGK